MAAERTVPHDDRILGLERAGCVPALAVLVVILLVSVGLPVFNALVPAEADIEPGTVLDVGDVAAFTPADSWTLDKSEPRAGEVVIASGATLASVSAGPATGSAEELASAVEDEIGADGGVELIGARGSIVNADGLTGVTGSFASQTDGGVYAVFVDQGVGVALVARGPLGEFSAHLREIEAMARSIDIAAGDAP